MQYKLYYFFKKKWVCQNFDTLKEALNFILEQKIMSKKWKYANYAIKINQYGKDKSILYHRYSVNPDGCYGVTYDTSNDQIKQFLDNHFFDNL